MKKVILENCEEGIPYTTLREINALRECEDHPGIIKLIDVFHERKYGHKIYLAFEYFNIDLKKYLERKEEPLKLT